jgi:hypothetical protein
VITLHVNCDNASPAVLERAYQYLVRTNQRSVNIAAGAELQKGMDFVDRVRAALPRIKVFWRNLDPEDTGIHAVKSAQWIFDHKVKPYLAWFKRNEIIFVFDNESSGDDNQIRNYSKCTVEFLVLMHSVNLATATCRFATGNIAERQYALLKPIFSAMLPSDWVSPNEYSNAPGKSSGGHLARYEQMWIAAGKPLPTFIGEAGVCPDYDPGKGFRSIGMSGKAHAAQLISEEVWYPDVDRALFVAGGFGWEGFQLIVEIGNGKVEADTLDALEEHYAKNPVDNQTPTPVPALPFVPIPADLSGAVEVVIADNAYRLQATATTHEASNVGRILPGERVTLYRSSYTATELLTWYWCERVSTPVGQSAYGWIAYRMPPPPDPVIVPPPTQSTAEAALTKVSACRDAIAIHQAAILALEAQIDELLEPYKSQAA